ncbi:MAG: hypothetical protein GWN73_36925, partial [Actinobacteria bacterium]|nr:hypothetical protein [Actinomycetota bacterium]NIS36081.1 hypothetical protein [Actinomycetota bacterium]NIU70656.1 hypothetical protein [Actinomycetota bacterium]
MNEDRTGVAHFEALPPGTTSLDVVVQGPGGVSATPSGRLHPVASSVTLTATPEPDAFFVGWGGDASGNESPLQLEMTASRVVTASFSRAGLPIVREDYEKG